MREILNRAVSALRQQAQSEAGHSQAPHLIDAEDTQSWDDARTLEAWINKTLPGPPKNTLETRGYNEQGKLVVAGTTTSFDPARDFQKMSGFLELERAKNLRGVEILPHKLGALWITSVEPRADHPVEGRAVGSGGRYVGYGHDYQRQNPTADIYESAMRKMREMREMKLEPGAIELLAAEPIDMILHCPKCGLQHIDAPEPTGMTMAYGEPPAWTNPPHRSHLCHGCGHIWRPADVATNGVAEIKTKGKADQSLVRSLAEDAKLARDIRELMGHWQDGSDTTVKLFQDDATRTFHVAVDKKSFWGHSLAEAVKKAFPR